MGLRFSPVGLRFSPRVFVLVHGVLGLRSSFLGLRFRNTLASSNVHRYHFRYCSSPWCFGENQRRSKISGNFQKRMEQHFPKFLRKRTTSRGQLCVESFSHRVKFTSLCSYTSFPPRVVSVDGNKVKKKENCNNNGDSYAGISLLFFFFLVLLCANFYNQIRTNFFGSIKISRKLPTHPSPKPSFCPK